MVERTNPFQERWRNEHAEVSPARADFEKEQLAIFDTLIKLDRNSSVLEFGCGKARTLNYYSSQSMTCVGIDISREVLQSDKSCNYKTSFIQGDMFMLPFKDASFDVVLSEGVIEHFDDWKLILSEATRVLKQGGQLVTAVPNSLNIPQDISLALQGKNFRYYPERPFWPSENGNLAKWYKKLGFSDLKFGGWKPGYLFDAFYLYDKKNNKKVIPPYTPTFRKIGRMIDNYINRLKPENKHNLCRWFGYQFVIVGTK